MDIKVSVVIPASGMGSRMNQKGPKQFIEVNGKSILAHTIEVFEKIERIESIIVVVGAQDVQFTKNNIIKPGGYKKVVEIVSGGKERRDSVYNGLKVLPKETTHVLIHDGARPLVKPMEVNASIECAKIYGACIVGVRAKDTIKIIDENGFVVDTPNRSRVYQIQTPQCFEKNLIIEAYENSYADTFPVTDDAMIVERYTKHKVKIVDGSYTNIKITTSEDLILMKQYLDNL